MDGYALWSIHILYDPWWSVTYTLSLPLSLYVYALYDRSLMICDIYTLSSPLSLSMYMQMYIMYDVGKKIEHLGIRIELIGQTEMLMDKANMKFMSMVKELDIA